MKNTKAKIFISPKMIKKMRLKSNVPLFNEKMVKWIIIESDENDTKGFFIYYHFVENSAYDTWHKTLENAFEAAETQLGIKKENWEELNDS